GGVPEVGWKDRQERVDVLAVVKPGPQVVHCHRVTQVMDAGSVTAAAVGDPGVPQEPPEVMVDVHQRHRLPWAAAREKPLAGVGSSGSTGVSGETVTQRLRDRELPIFAAFGVADLQNTGVEVNVLDAQEPGF